MIMFLGEIFVIDYHPFNWDFDNCNVPVIKEEK